MSAFKFMYAMQNPLMVAFRPLQKQPGRLMGDTVLNWDSAPALFMASQAVTFQVDWTSIVREFGLPSLDVASVAVLPCLFYVGGNKLRSCADSLPLDAFLRALGPVRVTSTPAPRAASSAGQVASAEVLTAFPWLTAMFTTESSAAETIESTDELVPSKIIVADEPLDDDAVQACFDELHKQRAGWQPAAAGIAQDFRCSLLGGAWLLRTQGRQYDAFKAECSKAEVKEWCRRYHLQISSRYSVEKFGMRVSSVLANGWAHRMQYYYNRYVVSHEHRYLYVEADDTAYVEATEFAEVMVELADEPRAEAIRSMRPSVPD